MTQAREDQQPPPTKTSQNKWQQHKQMTTLEVNTFLHNYRVLTIMASEVTTHVCQFSYTYNWYTHHMKVPCN